jgi:hypothetical protein
VRYKAHDSASGSFFCTIDIKATKRALAYGYISFKKHRKIGKSLFHCGTLPLRGFGCSCATGLPSAQKGELAGCLAAWDVHVERNAAPVLNVGRNFTIAPVGCLAQAVRASRAPQGVLFFNLKTSFRTHKERLNKNTCDDTRACFLLVVSWCLQRTLLRQGHWHFLGGIIVLTPTSRI